jgi:hypothetical protein
MLTNTSRGLSYLVAALYAVLGFILFFLPEQIAPLFAWKVTGFMTMTIGGWCLGNAWLSFFAARRWRWMLIYPGLIYLWTFGILETLIVIQFRDKLQLGHPIAWLYLAALTVNVLAALIGIVDWLRLRPSLSSTTSMTGIIRFWIIGFVLSVGFLGIYGLTAHIGDLATHGEIFPEVMSLFTLRAFGGLYFSLVVGMIPLMFEKDMTPFLNYGFLAVALIVIITIAAIVYLRLFNFQQHPFGAAYFGAYLLAGVTSIYYLRKYGTGDSKA